MVHTQYVETRSCGGTETVTDVELKGVFRWWVRVKY